MIKLNQASLRVGAQVLLENTDLTLQTQRKAGVIGKNGCGKSSLFKLILNELALDQGEMSFPSQWQISHMAQEITHKERQAVEYVIDGDRSLRKIQARIEHAENAQDNTKLALAYSELEAIDGYNAHYRAEKLLQGLGFKVSENTKKVEEFSGGWRIRLNLAQALMCPSDLLLLDEPTNHLDLDATMWLEQWLKAYDGTLLLISHDRDFLDNVVNEIIHIEHQKLNQYRGDYSSFERQRSERLAQQQIMFDKQQRRIQEIDEFVRRFKAKASKAKQAQSRIKELERMEKLAPAHVDSPFYFNIPKSLKMSSPLMSLTEADIGYGDTTILNDVSINILPGARIGLLGINGAGKSTLIKAMTEQIGLQTGSRSFGEHCAIGYFAQHQLQALDINASAILHIQRISPNAREQEIRNFLGGFDFHGDKATSVIHSFSGGEKARLALAIIVWQKPNLLLLDEPTNHLDLEMRHALTLALQNFEGALVVISHDRYLLRNTVDEYYWIHKGVLSPFDGTLEDYHQELLQQDRGTDKKSSSTNDKSLSKKELRQQAAAKRDQIKPLTSKIKKIEQTIENLNRTIKDIEQRLADPHIYDDDQEKELKLIIEEQGNIQKKQTENEVLWLSLQEQLDKIQQSE